MEMTVTLHSTRRNAKPHLYLAPMSEINVAHCHQERYRDYGAASDSFMADGTIEIKMSCSQLLSESRSIHVLTRQLSQWRRPGQPALGH